MINVQYIKACSLISLKAWSFQGPRIDFESEGAKIVLYLVSPRGSSVVDAGGKNFVFWFSKTQENAFLDAFSKNFVLCRKRFWFIRKVEGPWPEVAWALLVKYLS